MIAVLNNRQEMVKLLVSLGADTEMTSKKDETALVYAVSEQNPVIVETLVRAGANVNHLDSTRENLLLKAVRAHRADVLRALLSHETNNPVSTAFIDSAFEEAIIMETVLSCPYIRSSSHRRSCKQLNQVKRIDMIRWLIPMVSDCRVRVSNNRIFSICVSLVSSEAYSICELLLRHGFAYSGHEHIYPLLSDVSQFRLSFARLLILTSDDRQLLKQFIECVWRPQILMYTVCDQEHETVKFISRCLSEPLSLQDLCVITARTRLRGRMWRKIDALPLPPLLKDKLKLL